MGHRDKLSRNRAERLQARRLKAALLVLIAHDAGHLHPRCFGCGAADKPLEINHLYGRTYLARGRSAYRRALAYWREYWAGVAADLPELDLRCKACNSAYRPVRRPAVNEPF